MKNLGPADLILGMKIFKISNGISLILAHSIERILYKFDFNNSKPIFTPYDYSIALKKNTGEPMSQLKNSQLICLLLYIFNKTRLDISYAVGRLNKYTNNPSREY